MNLTLEQETPPLYQDQTGAIRVGNSRVLLELVIRAFQDGLSPESIVSRYSTLSLSDVYNAIAYYLRHQQTVETYLQEREQLAELVRERLTRMRLGDGEDGEDKLLGIEAFFIFRVFCKLEKLSFNLRLFDIINTSKFSRNS